MTKDFIEKVRKNGSIYTRKYLYMVGTLKGKPQIRRIEKNLIVKEMQFSDLDFVCDAPGWPNKKDVENWTPIY